MVGAVVSNGVAIDPCGSCPLYSFSPTFNIRRPYYFKAGVPLSVTVAPLPSTLRLGYRSEGSWFGWASVLIDFGHFGIHVSQTLSQFRDRPQAVI